MLSSKTAAGRIPWSLLALEALLVVLSVLLALGLNSWSEARSNDELALRSLQDITDEISINCARIEQFHPYHQEVANGEREPGGVQIGLIRNDAWESARSTGAAAYINYDVASVIGKIYASQNDHRAIFQSYTEALFVNIGREEVLDTVHGELDIVVIRELSRRQEHLLELYRELYTVLNEDYSGKLDTENFCGG